MSADFGRGKRPMMSLAMARLASVSRAIVTRLHLSTSPRTGSTDEMTATASATRPPRIMCGSVWRLTKLGPRMCMRYGLAEPSDTR